MAGHDHGKDHHSHTPFVPDPADAWHKHTTDEPLPQEAHAERVNVGKVLAYGVVGMVIIIASIVFVYVYFQWYATGLRIEREERPDLRYAGQARVDAEYRAYRAQIEEVELAQFGWVDPENNVVRLPLSAAQKKVIEDYAKSR